MQLRSQVRSVDGAIAVVARDQHGVVAAFQLERLGLGTGARKHRLRDGHLHRVHRGVYAVGHPRLTREGRWMAAVLAIGSGAHLSHRAAAAHFGIRPPVDASPEVTVGRAVRSRRTITVHSSPLPADEVTVHEGIPVTTPARAALDIAPLIRPHQLERAINEIEIRQLWIGPALPQLLERYPGRPGTPLVKEILGFVNDGGDSTLSDEEALFLSIILRSNLPRPSSNVPVTLADGTVFHPDLAWPREMVIVELDSRRFHDTSRSFHADRARMRALAVAGWLVIPVTVAQLHNDPAGVVRDIGAVLAQRR